jgi:hypothetical protein
LKNVHYIFEFSKFKLIKFTYLDHRSTNQLSNSGLTRRYGLLLQHDGDVLAKCALACALALPSFASFASFLLGACHWLGRHGRPIDSQLIGIHSTTESRV